MSRKTAFLCAAFLAVIGSCKTSAPERAYRDSGLMLAMIYDYDNVPVNGAEIFIDDKKIIESDIQGRFVLEFRKPGEYTITVSKKGYEDIVQSFTFDPMDVLYLKMVNASQLLTLAEEALDQYSYPEAEDFLDRALVLEPHRPDILYLKSITLYLQNKYGESREILEYLISTGIHDEYVTGLLGRLH
jgi:tetratricopeptide (TPR) repeat protein